jgi:hypothetical protein
VAEGFLVRDGCLVGEDCLVRDLLLAEGIVEKVEVERALVTSKAGSMLSRRCLSTL